MKKYSSPRSQEVLSEVNLMPGVGQVLEINIVKTQWDASDLHLLYILDSFP